MNEKGYAVLSVNEIGRLYRHARRKARADGKTGRRVGNHCIVLKGIEVDDRPQIRSSEGEPQIALSYSIGQYCASDL